MPNRIPKRTVSLVPDYVNPNKQVAIYCRVSTTHESQEESLDIQIETLLMEKESIVITGDAIALEYGKPIIANPQYTMDIDQATKSIDKLLSLNAKAYYCYHGGTLIFQ